MSRYPDTLHRILVPESLMFCAVPDVGKNYPQIYLHINNRTTTYQIPNQHLMTCAVLLVPRYLTLCYISANPRACYLPPREEGYLIASSPYQDLGTLHGNLNTVVAT